MPIVSLKVASSLSVIKKLQTFTTKMVNNNSKISHISNLNHDYDSANYSHHRLSWLVGYGGAMIIAFLITHNYLQFNTRTNVFIENPKHAQLPGLSICFFYKLKQLQFDGESDTRMTLKEINDSLPTLHDYMMSCEVLNANYEFEDCLQLTSKFNQYLSLYSKCYSLFQEQNPPIIYDKAKVGSDLLINVMLNVSKIETNNIGVYLAHSNQDLVDSLGDSSFVQFDSYKYNRASLTFEQTKIKSLPWPYTSKCRDYTKELCHTRTTCVNRCIINNSWQMYGVWNDRRYVKLQDDLMSGRFASVGETNLSSECNKLYAETPCEEYMYNSIVASELMSPFKTNDTYQVTVGFPITKFTTVQYVGLQSFIEFICFVTSIVSLWTEISVIKMADKVFRFMKSFALKCKSYRRRFNHSQQLNQSLSRKRSSAIFLDASKSPRESISQASFVDNNGYNLYVPNYRKVLHQRYYRRRY